MGALGTGQLQPALDRGGSLAPRLGLTPSALITTARKHTDKELFFLSVGGLAQVIATGYPMGVGDRGRERGAEGAEGAEGAQG